VPLWFSLPAPPLANSLLPLPRRFFYFSLVDSHAQRFFLFFVSFVSLWFYSLLSIEIYAILW
jgi:hypothetical protein